MKINPDKFTKDEVILVMLPFMERELIALKDELNVTKKLEFKKVCKYIVLLYSEDSILNVKPQRHIAERQLSALKSCGFPLTQDGDIPPEVDLFLIRLKNQKVFDVVFSYLIYQKSYLWSEIITLETQMEENQRLRLQPINEETDGKTMQAFDKKDKFTIQYKQWYTLLKSYYAEFFGDYDEVRKNVKHNLKAMATIENYAN